MLSEENVKPPLTVWTAPALGGKTRQCLQMCLQEGEQVYLILPSELQAQMARAILQAKGMPSPTASRVVRAFHAFALEVAQHAGEIRLVPAHLRRWLLQQAVRAVEPLEQAFQRKGMLTLLSAWVRELAREAITPEVLQSLVSCSKEPEKISALARVWQNYRRLLDEQRWREEEDVYLLASQALRGPAFDGRLPRRVLLDGFSRFSRTEIEFLRALAETGCEVTVTLCWEARSPSLFESTSTTLQWLGQHFEVQHVPLSAAPNESVSPAIAHIAGCLFGCPSSATMAQQASPAVEIWEAPHLLGEVEMVAREIVRLHRGGMAWGEIAVLCRDISSVLPTVESIFEQFGIPTQSFETRVLSEHPVVRTLIDLMRLNADGYPRDGILRWLKSGYLPVPLLEADRLRLLAVRQGVRGGASNWLRLAEEMERENSAVASLLKSLIECMQNMSQARIPQRWLDELQHGLNSMRFGMSPACIDVDIQDPLLQAIEVAQQVVSLLAHEEGGTPITWTEAIVQAWEATPQRQNQSLRNAVWLLEATRSRPLAPRVAFVMGMQEGRFPRRTNENAFLRDEERRWLNAHHSVHLHITADASAAERLAFYQSATCAQQRVIFTYSRTEGDHDVQSSFYLHSLREVFSRGGIVQRALRLSDITAPLSDALDERDVERTLVDSLFDRNPHTRRPLNEQERKHIAETVKEWLEHHPERCQQWWRWRYLPDFPRLCTAEPQVGVRSYSATELEELQRCPFRHFVRYEMKLRPDRTHYTAGQGRWLHAILHRHQCHPQKPLEEILQEVVQHHPVDRSFGERQLLIQQAEDMARSVIKREETIYQAFDLRTLFTEAVFGPAVDEEEEASKEAKPPLRVKLSDGRRMLIGGRIDRVDACPQTGVAVLVDYKRDLSNRWWQDIQAGEDFQTVLYTAALRQVWKLAPAAVALDSALDGKRYRLLFTDNLNKELLHRLNRQPQEDYGTVQLVNGERWKAIERTTVGKVGKILDQLLAGNISPTPGDHCGICEYQGLCRVVIEQGTCSPVHDGEPYPADL